MKKILIILLSVAVISSGCEKSTSSGVNIGASDLAAINGQLKGLWLFPTDDQLIVNSSGQTLADNGYISAPAMQFDGSSGVTVYSTVQTQQKATYQLSAKNGFVYVDVIYPNGNDITYEIISISPQTLKLLSTEPYVYYNGATPEPASSVSNIVLQKKNSADQTANLVSVAVASSTSYSVSVYVTHPTKGDTAILLDSRQNIRGTYNFAFPTTSGDQLNVDILGDYNQISFYAYFNGLPMTGNLSYGAQEIKTTSGWIVP